ELPPRDTGRAAVLQKAIERLAYRPHVAPVDQRLRHVRASRGAFLDEREDFRRIDENPQRGQLRDDAVDPRGPLRALLAQERLKPVGLEIEEVAEHVDLGTFDIA